MGVYIKGMEMPRSCRQCSLYLQSMDSERNVYENCAVTAKSYNWGLTTRPSDCPLIPAADVRPVVKAHWKPGDIRNVSAVCSNCGHLRLGNGAEWWATKLAYFCEKCGADMRPEPPKEGET